MSARAMKIRVGTSGFGYREWLGVFYPEKLASQKMLAYYGQRIATVEINLTFRRRVAKTTFEKWAESTPAHFRFALKAPFEITHGKKLRGVEKATQEFIEDASALGERLGPILFQLPPSLKIDPVLLTEFLAMIRGSTMSAFEFRHASWLDDSIFQILKNAGAALCVAETETLATPAVMTAPHVYLRLRKDSYQDARIEEWGQEIKKLARGADSVFAFFRHNVPAPSYAMKLAKLLDAEPPGVPD
jgi:uncharacterized protein YecE (DUF72 family)